MNKNPEISILSPAHQNERYIKEFVTSLFKDVAVKLEKKGKTCEVIIAEDGSTDNTRKILQSLQKKYNFHLLLAKVKLGPVVAIKKLFEKAKGYTIFFLDSDGEIAPSNFWNLYKVFTSHNYDIVVAYKKKRKPWYRFLISRMNNLWLHLLFQTEIRDANSGFRIYKGVAGRRLVKNCGVLKYNFNSEQIIQAQKQGLKIGETGAKHNARESTVFNPKKIFKILFLAYRELILFKLNMKQAGFY